MKRNLSIVSKLAHIKATTCKTTSGILNIAQLECYFKAQQLFNAHLNKNNEVLTFVFRSVFHRKQTSPRCSPRMFNILFIAGWK